VLPGRRTGAANRGSLQQLQAMVTSNAESQKEVVSYDIRAAERRLRRRSRESGPVKVRYAQTNLVVSNWF
jgi:hypothetical protein